MLPKGLLPGVEVDCPNARDDPKLRVLEEPKFEEEAPNTGELAAPNAGVGEDAKPEALEAPKAVAPEDPNDGVPDDPKVEEVVPKA